jgi:NAD(P)H-quinone oxidoreductase subunit 5
MLNESSFQKQWRERLGEAYGLLCLLTAIAASPWLDQLTNVLLLLTTLLFAIVTRYARRYLAGDPGQARFNTWLCITGTCVFALILVDNLLLFVLAWSATSLSLHHLLQFYKDRPGAILAARKKFLFSRLGDLCLLAVLFLTHRVFGTWDFRSIFEAAGRLRNQGGNLPAEVNAVCILLVAAALLKSAQFPFHSWLPDTMETPTPVSALMHAGIINAGGILVLRLRELITLSEAALTILCVVGAFTAVFAAVIMLTQASVKRCLAFSTIGQMGFMMLECGLGAFHLALLHLVAHSLYKAYAFLTTGSVVQTSFRITARPVHPALLLAGLATALLVSAAAAYSVGVAPSEQPILTGIFTLAMAQLLWGLWSRMSSAWLVPLGIALGMVFALGYYALDLLAAELLLPRVHEPVWLAWPVLAVFTLVAILQTQMPRLERFTLAQRLFVHARNGFYCNTLANRITSWLWPTPNPRIITSKGSL